MSKTSTMIALAFLSVPFGLSAQPGSPTACAPLTNFPAASPSQLGKILYAPYNQNFGPIPVDNGPVLQDFFMKAPSQVLSPGITYNSPTTQVTASFSSSPRKNAQSGSAYWLWENGGITLFCRLTTLTGSGVAGVWVTSDGFEGRIHYYPSEECAETGPSIGEEGWQAGGPSASAAAEMVSENTACDPEDDGSGSVGGNSGLYCDVIVQWDWVTGDWVIVGIDWDSCEWRDE